MEIVEDSYQVGATIIASQCPIKDRHTNIVDPNLADAICDRLLHNAYRLELSGDSMRRKNVIKTEDRLRGKEINLLQKEKRLTKVMVKPGVALLRLAGHFVPSPCRFARESVPISAKSPQFQTVRYIMVQYYVKTVTSSPWHENLVPRPWSRQHHSIYSNTSELRLSEWRRISGCACPLIIMGK